MDLGFGLTMTQPAESFLQQLQSWGPQAVYTTPQREAAEAYCRDLAMSHYENFQVVSWLLPRDLRQHFYNIYAYCRWSDDLADEAGSAAESLDLLQWWHEELRSAFFQGQAHHPVFVALQSTLSKFELTAQPFEDLLSAFKQDQTKLRYDTDEELLDYCTRSADPVGRMVLALGGAARAENFVWSDSICTGLQLANFCQDIAVDARKNRIYIPAVRLRQFEVAESAVLKGERTENLQSLLQQWCDYADHFLVQGMPLIKEVPSWLSLDVRLFIAGGRGILQEIRRHHYDVWSGRVSLSKARKLALVAQSTWQWMRGV